VAYHARNNLTMLFEMPSNIKMSKRIVHIDVTHEGQNNHADSHFRTKVSKNDNENRPTSEINVNVRLTFTKSSYM